MNCYNNAHVLHEALHSVYAQTFTDWEIIFWDDMSDDASLHLAQNFNAQDARLRCFQGLERVSLGHARNEALAKARGEFIAFLDCDDVWLPTKLEKQIKLMRENAHVGLVCTDAENFYVYNGVYKSMGRIFDTAKAHRGRVFRKLICGQWIAMSSVMLRRSCLNTLQGAHASGKYFDIKLNICEEAELFYRLAHMWDFDYVDEMLTKRRIHHKNITFTRFDELAFETEYILNKQYELYADFRQNYADMEKVFQQRAAFQRAIALWRQGQSVDARKTLRQYPSLKAHLFYVASFFPPILFPHFAGLYLKFAKYINR